MANEFGSLLFKPLIKRTLELLSERHCFSLELKDIDRNTTKKSWKEISRWLRVARNETEKKIDFDQLTEQFINLSCFGTNVIS